ncbi:PEP-CTERM motif protein [Opitutaceae bacterium TAV1]|nr:PEP-CTERM motif protein [Opitutaceae bacterium TAV1]
MKLSPLPNCLSAAVLFSVLAATPAFSGTLFEEAFNYPNGNLADNQGGTGSAAAWSGGGDSWTVSSGVATVKGSGGSTSTLAINPVSAATTSTFYFSLDLSVLEASAINSLNDALVFQMYNGTSNVDVFGIGIAYSYSGTTGETTVSARSTINGGTYGNFTPVIGETNTIVGKFTFTAGAANATLSLWWNPVNESSATFRTFTLTTPTSVDNISRLLLRRQATGAGNGADVSTAFDNIRIGTDWASATTPIPEPGTYAVVSGALILGVVVWMRRRR